MFSEVSPRLCLVIWVSVVALNGLGALILRDQPTGRAVAAGCGFFLAFLPMFALSIGVGVRQIRHWDELETSERLLAWFLVLGGFPLWALISWLWLG